MGRRKVCALLLTCLLTGTTAPAQAQEPRDLAELSLEELMALDVLSINVLGTHVHLAGEWMITYEYMFENMDGNRDGTRRVSHAEVLEQFPTVPTKMTMEMHMAQVMYAPRDDLTLMAMLPYVHKRMDHVTRSGVRFTERSEGFGDLLLRALTTVYSVRRFEHRVLLNAGVSVPSGSIDEKDFGSDRTRGRERLEYAMQLGSGTVDLLPGLVYLGQSENWAWGAGFDPTVRLGRNSNGYRIGNRYRLDGWGARKWTEWLSVSGRVDGQAWENITGADPTLNRAAAATKDPDRQAGERVDLLLGLTLYAPRGVLKGHRVAVEAGGPIYQSLEGPNLQTDWLLRVGWQWIF